MVVCGASCCKKKLPKKCHDILARVDMILTADATMAPMALAKARRSIAF
jgi:hypothetical protein